MFKTRRSIATLNADELITYKVKVPNHGWACRLCDHSGPFGKSSQKDPFLMHLAEDHGASISPS
jgi:hypothetical protein